MSQTIRAAPDALTGVGSTLALGHGAVASGMRWLATLANVLAIAGSPRFRASQRQRLRDASRHGMLLIVAAALADCVWLSLVRPEAAQFVVGLNALVALTATVAYAAIAMPRHGRPELMVLAALVVIDAATLTLGLTQPTLAVVAAAYLLLLPTIVALVVPWTTTVHLVWLGLHGAAVVAYAALAPALGPGATGRGELLPLVAMAILISLFGHATALRARIESFVHIERIRRLNRESRRDQLRLDRVNKILEQSARTDALTGLDNRLSLTLELAVVRARIARHRERYSLLMIDLDRFKAINDTDGHVAGDDMLRSVARLLVGAVRPEDGVFRLGGEEFVVLARTARARDGMVAAERIRRVIADAGLAHPHNPPHDRVTVSVGVTSIAGTDLELDDDAWLSRADQALYRAKAGGRNRCETLDSTVRSGSRRSTTRPAAVR
ncbi:MAG TPA: GGDEF domain-containing protein [Candidatus Polarisedimenticolia bacterium]|nr:GGDEF domain-containing protein [Candidatus Polarisedimenticolia bacterium]